MVRNNGTCSKHNSVNVTVLKVKYRNETPYNRDENGQPPIMVPTSVTYNLPPIYFLRIPQ